MSAYAYIFILHEKGIKILWHFLLYAIKLFTGLIRSVQNEKSLGLALLCFAFHNNVLFCQLCFPFLFHLWGATLSLIAGLHTHFARFVTAVF